MQRECCASQNASQNVKLRESCLNRRLSGYIEYIGSFHFVNKGWSTRCPTPPFNCATERAAFSLGTSDVVMKHHCRVSDVTLG